VIDESKTMMHPSATSRVFMTAQKCHVNKSSQVGGAGIVLQRLRRHSCPLPKVWMPSRSPWWRRRVMVPVLPQLW